MARVRNNGTMMGAVNAAYRCAVQSGVAWRAFPTMYGWRIGCESDMHTLSTETIRVYPDAKVERIDADKALTVLATTRLVTAR